MTTRGRIICPVCRQRVSLTVNGKVNSHGRRKETPEYRCASTGLSQSQIGRAIWEYKRRLLERGEGE